MSFDYDLEFYVWIVVENICDVLECLDILSYLMVYLCIFGLEDVLVCGLIYMVDDLFIFVFVCQWSIYFQFFCVVQYILVSGRFWIGGRMFMLLGKVGFVNDFCVLDFMLEKVECFLEVGLQWYVLVGMGGEVIVVVFDVFDQ